MKVLHLLLFFLCISPGFSQVNSAAVQTTAPGEPCKTDVKHNTLYQNDMGYRQRFDANQAAIQNIINSGVRTGGVYTIPVVVHVIHLGESEGTGTNISDAQIQSAIDNLTDAYRNTGYSGVDIEIEFQLAQRDPDCNSTTGINRINGSGVTGGGDNYGTLGITDNNETTIKALSNWPNSDYYNIWIVSEIDNNGGGSGTQGYAYFPGAGSDVDGAVILYNAFGYDPTGSLGYNLKSYTNYNATTIHELGHGLNLYNTFEGDDGDNDGAVDQCPGNSNCATDGDLCCDTDPHRRDDSDCSGTISNTCHGVSSSTVYNNFMAYSSDLCQNRFTSDQKTRMRAALEGTRSSLLTSLGTTAISGSQPSATLSCTPQTQDLANNFGLGIFEFTIGTLTIATNGSVDDGGYLEKWCSSTTLSTNTIYDVEVINRIGGNNENVKVYIDYNNDGDFSDTGEEIFSSLSNTTHTGTFTTPSSCVTGSPLWVRAISDFHGNTISGPCYAPTYGQVEDYSITINASAAAPVAAFSANNTTICAGASVTFTDASSDATSWSWNFGSGASPATATGAGPHTVTYSTSGTKTISLDVTGAGGSDNETKTDYITVNANVTPSVSISASANPITSGTSVTFTATPTNGGGSPSYQWKLNSSNAGTNSSTYINSTLADGDLISCVMTSSATCASPTTATSNTITMSVTTDPVPVAAFSANTTAICEGASVTFTDASSDATSWSWNFGSGASPATATGAGPHTVTYSTSGSATVSLDVTGAGGSDNETKTNYITINASVTPAVSISASANPITSGTSVTFTATPTNGGGSPSYQWKLNGSNAGTNSTTYTSSALADGDLISCVLTSSATCASPTTATSNTITMSVSSGTCSTPNTGPGGVGTSSTNILWLDASSVTGVASGSGVSLLSDNSGNGNNGTQATLTSQPTYYPSALNGKPALMFDGSDYLQLNSNITTGDITVFSVATKESTASGYRALLVTNKHHVFSRTSNGHWGGWYNPDFVSSGYYLTETPSVLKMSTSGSSTSVNFRTNGNSINRARGTTVNKGSTLIGANPSGSNPLYFHQGYIGEMICFNTVLNLAQQLIIENYLAAKYQISIVSDLYAFDSSHGYELAGIGQASNGTSHASAKGSGIVEMNTPSNLSSGEFILWAHNNASTASSNTDVPTAYGTTGTRMSRVWRADKTNDPGTVTVTFYLDGISSGSNLELLVDADGTFTNATRITSGFTYNSTCNTATWTGVSFSDGNYFTIGSPDGSALMISIVEEDNGSESESEFTGIDDVKNELLFKLYPNPTDGIVTLENNIYDGMIYIYNNMGQLAMARQIFDEKETIDLSDLSSGIYFIQVIDRQKQMVFSHKLIIKR